MINGLKMRGLNRKICRDLKEVCINIPEAELTLTDKEISEFNKLYDMPINDVT
jgi:hypothetical protein